jgi:hypothetical protein
MQSVIVVAERRFWGTPKTSVMELFFASGEKSGVCVASGTTARTADAENGPLVGAGLGDATTTNGVFGCTDGLLACAREAFEQR